MRNSQSMQCIRIRVGGSHVRFEGRGINIGVRYSRGLRYLLEILKNPEREHHVLDLYYNEGLPMNGTPVAKTLSDVRLYSKTMQRVFSRIPMTDQQCIREVKSRIAVINGELDEIQDYHDHARMEDLQIEREKLLSYLSEVLSPHNNIRSFETEEGKLVDSIRKAIIRSLEDIAEFDPDFAQTLRSELRLWKYLSHRPHAFSFDIQQEEGAEQNLGGQPIAFRDRKSLKRKVEPRVLPKK